MADEEGRRAAGAEGHDAVDLEACVEALVRVMPQLNRVFKSQMKGQLTPPQMHMMLALSDGAAQPGELARRCALSNPATTAILDSLVEDGLCIRAHSEEDRRKVLVRPTTKGLEMLAQARVGATAAMRELLGGWDTRRVERLYTVVCELDEAARSYLGREGGHESQASHTPREVDPQAGTVARGLSIG